MLLVKDLEKTYGDFKAIDSVNFFVEKGEIIGLLGENGAGKTTLINLITSMIKPSYGKIELEKFTYGTKEYKRNIGVAFGGEVSLYDRLTVRENLNYFAALYGIENPNVTIAQLGELFDFVHYENKKIEQLSRGMKQRISLAISLIHNPELILFDEPTIGLDISGQNTIKQLVKLLKEKGKTVIYSTNIIPEVEEICDKIIILHKGNLKEFDTISNIECKYQKRIKEIFLDIIRR
ncbi:ABC transporter ATP-binding protein [Anaerococcus sp. Marseille-P3915]|uniref:ABC transporter ATP-binding protein n=1 Tax=Anaerococcus sp. Marseille-P3915 TaxID=2057799 RepID=UPI000D0BB153|nr:ABC transporter ATP-binding protein [Anaerococcus sp. Marseille-P3915]